jgi:Uma2 family endonuclease
MAQEKRFGVRALPEQRVQVKPTRYRIPDVCVLRAGAPREEVITHPPLLWIEVLSKDDSMSSVMERVEEYLAMGVPYVWVIDPWRQRGYECTINVIREPKDGVLRTQNPELSVPLVSLFD